MHYSFLIGVLLSTTINAHMTIIKPIPFRSPLNIYNVGQPDYSLSNPLLADGSDFPCKGYHLLGMPSDTPVETWEAGSEQIFTMSASGATHGGGSCQASISEDSGETFKAIKSYIGNCPILSASYNFTVPKETRTGNVLFAWTWFNHMGNREMYMNCAAITINGTDGAGLSTFPEIFKANIGPKSPGCATEEGFDVVFPEPGLDVETAPSATTKIAKAGCIHSSLSSAIPVTTPASASIALASTSTASTHTSSSPPATTSSPSEGCMCSCGGPNGYLVNIIPVGGVSDMILNSTDTVTAASSTVAVRPRR